MGAVGDACDNAMAESVFAKLECELIDDARHHLRIKSSTVRGNGATSLR